MTFNSGFDVLKEQNYQMVPGHSSPPSSRGYNTWIQPPIASQVIDTNELIIIDGVYAQVRPQQIDPTLDLELELEAWEAASDEALRIFEAQLD